MRGQGKESRSSAASASQFFFKFSILFLFLGLGVSTRNGLDKNFPVEFEKFEICSSYESSHPESVLPPFKL